MVSPIACKKTEDKCSVATRNVAKAWRDCSVSLRKSGEEELANQADQVIRVLEKTGGMDETQSLDLISVDASEVLLLRTIGDSCPALSTAKDAAKQACAEEFGLADLDPSVETSPALPNLVGTGAVVSEDRKTGPFSQVYVTGNANLYVSGDDQTSVRIEAQKNLLPRIETRLEPGQNSEDSALYLDVRGPIDTSQAINIYIAAPDLWVVSHEGTGVVKGKVDRSGQSFHLAVNEGTCTFDIEAKFVQVDVQKADVTLTGRANGQEHWLFGPAKVDAASLLGERVKVHVEDGTLAVHATQEIFGDVSHKGVVEYAGEPKSIEIRSVLGGTSRPARTNDVTQPADSPIDE